MTHVPRERPNACAELMWCVRHDPAPHDAYTRHNARVVPVVGVRCVCPVCLHLRSMPTHGTRGPWALVSKTGGGARCVSSVAVYLRGNVAHDTWTSRSAQRLRGTNVVGTTRPRASWCLHAPQRSRGTSGRCEVRLPCVPDPKHTNTWSPRTGALVRKTGGGARCVSSVAVYLSENVTHDTCTSRATQRLRGTNVVGTTRPRAPCVVPVVGVRCVCPVYLISEAYQHMEPEDPGPSSERQEGC